MCICHVRFNLGIQSLHFHGSILYSAQGQGTVFAFVSGEYLMSLIFKERLLKNLTFEIRE